VVATTEAEGPVAEAAATSQSHLQFDTTEIRRLVKPGGRADQLPSWIPKKFPSITSG
jgi:hypothetical protein